MLGGITNMGTKAMMDDIKRQEAEQLTLQKREAYVRLSAVWQDALGAGIEPEVLAHVAIFAALGDLIATYGETAVADFAERLSDRISAGEFTVPDVFH
jgi:hypothetical protein